MDAWIFPPMKWTSAKQTCNVCFWYDPVKMGRINVERYNNFEGAKQYRMYFLAKFCAPTIIFIDF
jgi:hypothetical protein